MVPKILSRIHGQSRTYWDTSGKLKNFPVALCYRVVDIVTYCVCSAVQQPVGSTGSGLTEVRIDCTISDGPRCPAHVVTCAEAKFTWDSASDKAEAVGQLWVSLLSGYVAFVQSTTHCTACLSRLSTKLHTLLVVTEDYCLHVK